MRKLCKNCYLFPFIFSMFTQDYYGWVHLNCDGVNSVNMTITVVDMTLWHKTDSGWHTMVIECFTHRGPDTIPNKLVKTLCIQDSKYPFILASDWSIYPDTGLRLVSLPRHWPLIGLSWHQMQGSTKFEWVSSASVSPLTMVKWYAPGFSLVRSGHHWPLIGQIWPSPASHWLAEQNNAL